MCSTATPVKTDSMFKVIEKTVLSLSIVDWAEDMHESVWFLSLQASNDHNLSALEQGGQEWLLAQIYSGLIDKGKGRGQYILQ